MLRAPDIQEPHPGSIMLMSLRATSRMRMLSSRSTPAPAKKGAWRSHRPKHGGLGKDNAPHHACGLALRTRLLR